MTPELRQLLERFSASLPAGGRVLVVSEEGAAATWLKAHGYAVEELDASRDLRMLSLAKEKYAGVWCERGLGKHSIEDAQRVVASFFNALVPGTGALFAMHRFDSTGFASMMRQNGFVDLVEGRREGNDWTAVVTRRL